jgi:hypothetical protein
VQEADALLQDLLEEADRHFHTFFPDVTSSASEQVRALLPAQSASMLSREW